MIPRRVIEKDNKDCDLGIGYCEQLADEMEKGWRPHCYKAQFPIRLAQLAHPPFFWVIHSFLSPSARNVRRQ
jgi:hypothetical protein